MDEDFIYTRLVTNFGVVYICFGPTPKDLLSDMIRALNAAIKTWPRRSVSDWYFEANPEAIKIILNRGLLLKFGVIRWGIGGEPASFYDTEIREVYPEKLEPSRADTKSEAFAVAIREIARGGANA